MVEDWQHAGFGIYIHWPYCLAKCPYCDFNSHVSRSINHDVWLAAYLSELGKAYNNIGNRTVSSIYFGGGTPSLMPENMVATIIDQIYKYWSISNNIEITLEANPTSVEANKFQGFKAAGLNRISMGIQALNNHDLKRLGRMHSVTEALTALDVAKSKFDRVSFDLIYGRQNQSLSDWEKELKHGLTYADNHMSAYQLTIEPNTRFGDLYKVGKLKDLPSSELASDLYFLTQEIMNDANMPSYEISNHATKGSESRHNLLYWNYGDYLGIGPGAHGRLTLNSARYEQVAISNPDLWLKNAHSERSTLIANAKLNQYEQAQEYLMMSMRIKTGCDLTRFNQMNGKPIKQSKLDYLSSTGFIEAIKPNHISLTPKGQPVANEIILQLLS